MTRRLAVFSLASVLALALTAVGRAQSELTGTEVLQQVAGVYGHMKTLKGAAHLVTERAGPGMSSKLEADIVLELAPLGKMRIEMQNATTGPMTVINDGSTIWMSMPQLNSYMKFVLPPSSATEQGVATTPAAGMNVDLLGLAKNVKEARLLRSEPVTLNGQSVDCYVVQTEYQQSAKTSDGSAHLDTSTLWIDKTRFLVVRAESVTKNLGSTSPPVESHQSLTFKTLDLDGPLDDSLFVFTPPAGAKQLDLSQFMPKPAAPPASGQSSPPQ